MDRPRPPGIRLLCCVVAVACTALSAAASAGDTDPSFQSCLENCRRTGCVASGCIAGCPASPASAASSASAAAEAAGGAEGLVAGPWDLRLLRWDCGSECKYECMQHVEAWRQQTSPGAVPLQYYGKWPFLRVLGCQEIASSVFSFLNFLANLYGLHAFLHLVYFQLPRKPMGDKGPVHDYAGVVTVYGLLSLNSWLWSAVLHARDTKFTEAWDYCSAVALIGFSLVLAIIRAFSLRAEASRVMVGAPIVSFLATHIFYLNFYTFDYGWNMVVCVAMGVSQLLIWTLWAIWTRHPAALKVLLVAAATCAAMLLEIFDFAPWRGLVDAHALWHATTVPISLLWWSFLCDDARARTTFLLTRKTRARPAAPGSQKKTQ